MKRLAKLVAAAVLGIVPAVHASSTTSTDYSDLWWNPAESGWGAHVTLQGDVVFLVLYVYDAEQRPRFFVAPATQRVGDSEAFSGPLFRTQGPAFNTAFDPAQVSSQEVGSAHLEFVSPTTAQLRYTVGSSTVTKTLTRQAWRAPNLAGDYKGGLFATATPQTCPLGLPSVSYPGAIKVRQSGNTITFDHDFAPGFAEWGRCRYTGTAVQSGSQLAVRNGTYSCEFENTNVASGTFEIEAIEPGPYGFSGRYRAVEGAACIHAGYFGGFRQGYESVDLPDTEDPPPDFPNLPPY